MTGAELASLVAREGLGIGLAVFAALGAWALIRSNAKRSEDHMASDDKTRVLLLEMQQAMTRDSQEAMATFSQQMLGSILDGTGASRGPSLRSLDRKLDEVATTAKRAEHSADRALQQSEATGARVDLLALQVADLRMRVDDSLAQQLASLTQRVDDLTPVEGGVDSP